MNKLFLILFTIGSVALLAGSWFQVIPFSITEDLGFITGALTVWLTVVENIWNFPIGIANDIFFFVLFLEARFFADMSLQILYIVLGFQGWYLWLRGGKNKTALQVSNISKKQLLLLALIAVIATYAITTYLQHIQDSAPFWDALTTVWSNVLFGTCPAWVYEAADATTYDLYLVTDIDVPWIDDTQRYFSDKRQEFLNLCLQALQQRNRPYIMISGTWDERLSKAIQAIEKLLKHDQFDDGGIAPQFK